MKTRVLWCVFAGTLFACAGPSWPAIDRARLPKAAEHPGDDAVVLLDQTAMVYSGSSEGVRLEVTHRRRVLILNPKGSSAARLLVHYNSSFSRPRAVGARVSRPGEDAEHFGLHDVGDHPAFEGSILHHDGRVLERDFGALPAGTIVDTEVVLDEHDPTWRNQSFTFGDARPVSLARLEVVVPSGWSIDHRAVRLGAGTSWEPERALVDGRAHSSWTAEGIPAIANEPHAPSRWEAATRVVVRLAQWTQNGEPKRGFASLEEYAKWMAQVQAGTDEPTREMEAIVREVVAAAGPDPNARAEALYGWVQSNVRYVAVELGIGGWRPHTAAQVFEHRYGDCKDKANLLKTMLRVAGIESHLAEIYSHDGVPRQFLMPNVGNGNHAILAVRLRDEWVLADPTTRTVPFGALPTSDQGAQALILHPERPVVLDTVWSLPSENETALTLELNPAADGTARGSAVLEGHGEWGWSRQAQLLARGMANRDELFAEWSGLEHVRARNVEIESFGRRAVRATADINLERVGATSNHRIVLRPGEALWNPGRGWSRATRTQPVVFGRPILRKCTVRIRLDLYDVVEALPAPTVLESEFGRFHQSWTREENVLVMESRFERAAGVVQPDRYPALVGFLNDIVSARSQAIILRRKEVP